jgi:hypothetical protein
MFYEHREKAFPLYRKFRERILAYPEAITSAEEYVSRVISDLLTKNSSLIKNDYDWASTLFPFWQNYPPEERGRMPIGDQFPWIEVGEHAVGTRLAREIASYFDVLDIGFPTGADQRFLLRSTKILDATEGITDSIWLLTDIKSVGPRDDQDHAVMSHNQISGSGHWEKLEAGVVNEPMLAWGRKASHDFYPAIPPFIIGPELKPALTVTMVVKPVYEMLGPVSDTHKWGGQPLKRIDQATIPNGLLLTQNPNLLNLYPGLLFPGKDDKSKDPRKLRARVSFKILREINPWRYQTTSSWTR